MNPEKKAQLEAQVREDFKNHEGHQLLVTGWLHGRDKQGHRQWHTDEVPYRVRVIATEEKDLLLWIGPWIHPIWQVEIVHNPDDISGFIELSGGHSFWINGLSYLIDGKAKKGITHGWELDCPY